MSHLVSQQLECGALMVLCSASQFLFYSLTAMHIKVLDTGKIRSERCFNKFFEGTNSGISHTGE